MLAELASDPSVLLPFILIGFAAQLVDGALGMAYGTISSTLLVGLGVPPAVASAGVHTAETFTTGISAISHVAHRNVDWRLFARIVVPGVIGGVIGAYVLSNIHAEAARPFATTGARPADSPPAAAPIRATRAMPPARFLA